MSWRDDPSSREDRKPKWQSDPIAKRTLTDREDRRAPDSEASPREALRRRLLPKNAGVTNALVNGFAFGLGDEAAGVATGASNAIVGGVGDVLRGVGVENRLPSFNPVAAYDRGRDEYLADIERAKREVPAGTAVAEGVGLAGAVMSPANYLRRITTLGGAVRAGATQGAVGGALAGAGNAEGGLANRAAASGLGALGGAAVGAALPVSINVAKAGYRAARGMTGIGPSVAPQVVARALQSDGGIRQAREIVEAGQARGVPLALGDTGDNARAILASTGRQPGPARTIARDTAISRQENQGERIAGAIERDLGEVTNVREASERLIKQAKRNAAPLYDEAYAAPIAITDDLQSILTRIPPQAVRNAQALARLEGRSPTELGVDLDDAGEVVLRDRPSMQTLDYIKRGMDDVVETFRDGTTGRLNLNTQGRAVNDVLRDFIDELDFINPAYGAARAAYSGPTKMAAALKEGRAAINATADDILVKTRDLTEAERQQFQLGLRSGLLDKLEGSGDYANRVRLLIGTPRKRAALAEAFGGEADLDRFFATLADEARIGQTYQSVAGNSLTAERSAFDAATGDQGLLNTAAGAATDVARGGYVAALTRVLADLKNYGAGEAGQRVRAEVAAALSETDPAVLREALRQASRAQAGQRLQSRQSGRSAIMQGQGAGVVTGGFLGRLLSGSNAEQ